MTDSSSLLSPRLQALQQSLAAADPTALETFWEEIRVAGAPLFEAIPDNTGQVYCTFLYRAEKEQKNVLAAVSFLEPDLEKMHMERLDGSDLWFKTVTVAADIRTTYRIAPDDSLQSLLTLNSMKEYEERTREWITDPLNSSTYVVPADEEDIESSDIHLSILAGPAFKGHTHVAARAGVPAGTITRHRISSQILQNERQVHVYTPSGYSADDEPYHLLLLFDGGAYASFMNSAIVLDNLLAEGAIAPTVAVMVDNAKDARSHELPPNEGMPEFLRKELMPWVRERYHITTDPAQTVIGGLSYGGLAAAWNAFKAPDLFGNVLSQSGSYWWSTNVVDPQGDPEPGWLIRQYAASERLPLYFYLDVGLLENRDFFSGASHRSLNRHMRDVLRAKGYPVSYAEYSGGHDFVWWEQTIADGLLALHRMRSERL